MKITILGCGNAFSNVNYNQCFLLSEFDNEGMQRNMILDYGFQAPNALNNAGLKVTDIDDIYISHAHADHCGGLEHIAFSRYDWMGRAEHYKDRSKTCTAPTLIANDKLLRDLWNKTLRGGLESMEGFDATIETYFVPQPIKGNQKFKWMGWTCRLIQQVHIMTGSMIANTYGLFMEKEGHSTIYFTTDSQYCSPRQMEIFYKEADIIFQDCECIGLDTKERKFEFASGVHASFAQLAAWPSANSIDIGDDIRAKMYLSHYQDFVRYGTDYRGQECNWNDLADECGFAKGFLYVGQEIEV